MRISIDVAGIRASLARERPQVADEEWDAAAYVDERIAAYREALRTLSLAHASLSLQVVFDAEAAAGDCLMVSAAGFAGAGLPETVVQSIADAVRPVTADTGGWRRHLPAGYFDRYRARRREAGRPNPH